MKKVMAVNFIDALKLLNQKQELLQLGTSFE